MLFVPIFFSLFSFLPKISLSFFSFAFCSLFSLCSLLFRLSVEAQNWLGFRWWLGLADLGVVVTRAWASVHRVVGRVWVFGGGAVGLGLGLGSPRGGWVFWVLQLGFRCTAWWLGLG
jgi:hypothetical protein